MVRLLLFLVVLGIVVYALADLTSAKEEETGGMPKWGWALLIVLLPGAGAAGWLLFRRLQRTAPAPGRAARPGRRPKPVAPDDDPEFLWRLEQERRRREREAGGTGRPGAGDGRADGDGPASDGGTSADGAGDNATP
ncbi:PLD nuclease N-terminal domain-containing protein [Puerhibacterium sp. TATVAM-FAB25]|uniref:PLD nuclease N-terminal domain-containing protein n=1 Tax=Puerhibacterium sp. TATVAM-FAB25 TaxID=3093699 RepID=UPI00397D3190